MSSWTYGCLSSTLKNILAFKDELILFLHRSYVAGFNLVFFLCGIFIPLGFCPQRFFPDPCRSSRDLNLIVCILALGNQVVISFC